VRCKISDHIEIAGLRAARARDVREKWTFELHTPFNITLPAIPSKTFVGTRARLMTIFATISTNLDKGNLVMQRAR
jgi:hypothetical protein